MLECGRIVGPEALCLFLFVVLGLGFLAHRTSDSQGLMRLAGRLLAAHFCPLEARSA